MAKDGAGALIGDFLLLGLIVLIVLIAINWLRGQQSAQQRIAAGSAGGVSGGTGAAAPGGISAALMQAWTNLTKAATSGQALANLTLGTSSPGNSALLPYLTPQGANLNQFAQPIDYGSGLASLGSLGSFSLAPSDPSSSALIPTIPLQTFNMGSIGFPIGG